MNDEVSMLRLVRRQHLEIVKNRQKIAKKPVENVWGSSMKKSVRQSKKLNF